MLSLRFQLIWFSLCILGSISLNVVTLKDFNHWNHQMVSEGPLVESVYQPLQRELLRAEWFQKMLHNVGFIKSFKNAHHELTVFSSGVCIWTSV